MYNFNKTDAREIAKFINEPTFDELFDGVLIEPCGILKRALEEELNVELRSFESTETTITVSSDVFDKRTIDVLISKLGHIRNIEHDDEYIYLTFSRVIK